MNLNANLNNAKHAKQNEFYTRYEDIARALPNYNLEGQTIYCNCDHWKTSNFVKYIRDHFHDMKIKKLISTSYNHKGQGDYFIFDGRTDKIGKLQNNGHFNSPECWDFMEQADCIISNPPFSMFREYTELIWDFGKWYIIIGPNGGFTYRKQWRQVQNCNMYIGSGQEVKDFHTPNGGTARVPCFWYTNMNYSDWPELPEPTETYEEGKYKFYDTLQHCIDVPSLSMIPSDWRGLMGLPQTIFKYYHLYSDFEMIGILTNGKQATEIGASYVHTKCNKHRNDAVIEGEINYKRAIIRWR